MFRLFAILIFILFPFSSNSDELKNNLSEFTSEFFTNLVPGDGETEISVDIRENYKPDYSILLVRELMRDDKGNLFTQLSIFNTEKLNDERIVANFGLGKRLLGDGNTLMTGYNAFLDLDEDGNIRTSLGGEVRNAVLSFNANLYEGLQDANGETVLDGYDLKLNSQIPYLHWAKAFVSNYKWDGVDRDDIEGMKLGTNMQISPTISLEAAYDDKDKSGLEDEYYFNLMFNFPPQNGPTMQDGIGSTAWKEDKDMSGELLSKVDRQNKIVVEFKGLSTISRTD